MARMRGIHRVKTFDGEVHVLVTDEVVWMHLSEQRYVQTQLLPPLTALPWAPKLADFPVKLTKQEPT